MTDADDLRAGIADLVGTGLAVQNSRLFSQHGDIYTRLRHNLDGLIGDQTRDQARTAAETNLRAREGGRERLLRQAGIPESEWQNMVVFSHSTQRQGVTTTEYIITTNEEERDPQRTLPRAIIADVRGTNANGQPMHGTIIARRSTPDTQEPTVISATANLPNGNMTHGTWQINQNATIDFTGSTQVLTSQPGQSPATYRNENDQPHTFTREDILERGREVGNRRGAIEVPSDTRITLANSGTLPDTSVVTLNPQTVTDRVDRIAVQFGSSAQTSRGGIAGLPALVRENEPIVSL